MVLPRRISLQAIYFLYFGSLGSLLPFMSLIFSERGISPTDIGWLMMLIPACNLVIPPLWGIFADARQSRVPALVLALLGTATGAILLTPAWSFAQMMGVMVFFGLFRAPITALLDAVTHSHIPDSPEDFGRFRLWGSVGFLLCSALFGFLRDTLVESSPLLGTALILLLGALAAVGMPETGTPVTRRKTSHVGAETLAHLRTPLMACFLGGVVLYYASHGVFDAYVSLHLRSLGFSDSFIGLTWTLGVSVEVLLMAFSPAILRRYSPGTLLCLASLTACVRWGVLSVATTSVEILAQQPLHAVTFGLWYLSCAKWVQSSAPAHLRATLQSVFLSCMASGMLVGFVVGGRCFEVYGGGTLYAGAALLSLLSLLFFLPLHLKRNRVTD